MQIFIDSYIGFLKVEKPIELAITVAIVLFILDSCVKRNKSAEDNQNEREDF